MVKTSDVLLGLLGSLIMHATIILLATGNPIYWGEYLVKTATSFFP